MTIVQVDKELPNGGWCVEGENKKVYVSVPSDGDISAVIREAAFRFVNKRKENDYTEMANHTSILAVENMSEDQFNIMFTHVN